MKVKMMKSNLMQSNVMKLNLMQSNVMKLRVLLVCLAAVFFSSCLGVSADITVKADGSGKIALEYRVSQALESLGRLDGNERWPAVPVGRADFERSAARIPGLTFSKYSVKDLRNASGDWDTATKVTLGFKDANTLLAFLDSAGSRAALVEESGGPSGDGKLLRLTLLDPAETVSNPDLLSLLKDISAGYDLSFSFNLPRNARITTVPASVPAAKLGARGKKASFSIGMGDLLSLNEGLVLEIRW